MPQLAPVNWLLLFYLFWFVVITSSVLIWWVVKFNFSVDLPAESALDGQADEGGEQAGAKCWSW